MAERTLTVKIIGDASSLERAFTRGSRAGQRFSVGIGTILKSAIVFDVFQKAVEGVTGALHEGISEFTESTKIQAQTAAALKSTGAVAGVTAGQINDLGLKLSNLSGIDDELVRKGENVLLSFTDIRNEAGKNNDIFNQATKAVVNYAARTGRDVPQAAVILGRALADPSSRLASLSRAGVVFTRTQIDMVKQIQKTQGIMAAQKVVLAELEKRFGGAAAAAGKTLSGQLNILRERFKDFTGEIVGAAAPAVSEYVKRLTAWFRRMNESGRLQQDVNKIMRVAAGIISGVVSVLQRAVGVAQSFAGAVGGWKNAIAIAVGAFAGLKIAGITSAIAIEVANVAAAAGTAAAWRAALISTGWGAFAVAAGTAAALIITNWSKVKRFFVGLADSVKRALDHAWQAIERGALRAALRIVEPFSHLPTWLGGGPFQQMKAAFQSQLDEMTAASATAATQIAANLSGVTAVLPAGADRHGPAASRFTPPTKSVSTPQRFFPQPAVTTPAAKAATAAAAKVVDDSFTLPFRLRLAEAKAEATKTAADDLRVARQIKAFILASIPALHGEKLIGAYQALASENQAIASAVQAAADKMKGSAQAIHTAFQKTNVDSILKGLGLDPATAKAIKARLSQLGPGGTVPGRGFGAFGVPVLAGAAGSRFELHTHISLGNREIATSVDNFQTLKRRQNPRQRRGFAGSR